MCCIVKCCNCHILLAVDMAGVACQGLVCVCIYMCVCVCVCVCEVGKMVKDIGMTIRKGIVVFLPCLVAFWGFHPYMFFHFFKYFFVLLVSVVFVGRRKG